MDVKKLPINGFWRRSHHCDNSVASSNKRTNLITELNLRTLMGQRLIVLVYKDELLSSIQT